MNILQLFNFTFVNPSSEAIEIFLRNASFCTLFLSMMFYWIQTAFSSMKKVALPLAIENGTTEGVLLLDKSPSSSFEEPLLSPCPFPPSGGWAKEEGGSSKGSPSPFGGRGEGFKNLLENGVLKKTLNFALFRSFFMPKLVFNGKSFGVSKLTNFGTITMILSNILLICLLIFRWRESGHFPLSNLYESLMFLSWSCTCIHLILDQVVKTAIVRLDATLLTKLIGSITSPSALFTNAFATFSLPAEMQKASPLVPALQSNWLMMHVTVMIISYSALILGSLLSIAFLILISTNSSSTSSGLALQGLLPSPNGFSKEGVALFSPSSAFLEKTQGQQKSNEIFQKTKQSLAWNFDNLSYRVLGIGFPFLTIGILSGAVWANEAWGSYWSWDPKETWALLTWLIFAIYLHARITKGWQGKKPAIIASFGFFAIWVCFLGVNLIGEGLHSYGWFSLS